MKPRKPITTRTLKIPLPPFPDGTGWALFAGKLYQEKDQALEKLATTAAALGLATQKVAELTAALQTATANVRRLEAMVQKSLEDHHAETVEGEVEVDEEDRPSGKVDDRPMAD